MPAIDLRIPDRHRSGFSALLSYDTDQLEALIAALKKLPPTLLVRSTARQIANGVGLPEDEVFEILRVLASLFSLRDHPGIPETELPKKIVAALKNDPKIEIPETKEGVLLDFFAKVLTLARTFGVTAKALSVAREFQRLYCYSRIFTDIRPVFIPDTEDPAAVMVLHSLKIAYHEGEGLREFFVALSGEDLRELLKTVERAIRKENTIKPHATKTDLCLLEEGD